MDPGQQRRRRALDLRERGRRQREEEAEAEAEEAKKAKAGVTLRTNPVVMSPKRSLSSGAAAAAVGAAAADTDSARRNPSVRLVPTIATASRRMLAGEAETARGRLGGAINGFLWSIKNAVLTSMLNVPSAAAAAAAAATAATSAKQGQEQPHSCGRRMMTHSASKNSLGRKKGYDKLGKLEDEDDDGEEAEQNTTTNNNNGRKSDQRPKALLASASSSSSAAGGAATVVTRLRRCDRDWRDAADDDSDDDDGSADDSESNDSWEDYSCVVCERAFFTARQLERHQLKKRHWGCSECDRRFNSEILLEYHKDEFDHWSEDDLPYDSEDSDWDSLREVMNEEKEEEPEFGPGEEEREMLL